MGPQNGPAADEAWMQQAVALLRKLPGEADVAHTLYFALRAAMQLALALHRSDEPVEACTALLDVLRVAAAATACQTMTDERLETRTVSSFAAQSENRLGKSGAPLARPDSPMAPGDERMPRLVTGSLSPRERNILELIAGGNSNKEIAQTLDIAPETVKSHVKHVFVKLGVEKRAQAVARAQSLGLFRSPWSSTAGTEPALAVA